MPAYTDRSKRMCVAALARLEGLLSQIEFDYRIIGGSAVLLVVEAPARGCPADHVGTLDVDIAVQRPTEREALQRVLLDSGGRQDPQNAIRIWIPVAVGDEDGEVPVDIITSDFVSLPPGQTSPPTLPPTALLLSKMRPYENKGAKGKDGYDAYMLLAHAAAEPEELAEDAIGELPEAAVGELLHLIEVFFMNKRRAARDAAMLLRVCRGADRSAVIRHAVTSAERFAHRLRSLLPG